MKRMLIGNNSFCSCPAVSCAVLQLSCTVLWYPAVSCDGNCKRYRATGPHRAGVDVDVTPPTGGPVGHRVSSDQCSVFHQISAANLHALQSVLNAAARLVMRKHKYDHITATLRDDLHCTNCAPSSTNAYTQQLHHTCQNCVYQSPPALDVISCVQQHMAICSCQGRPCQHTDLAVSPSPDLVPGISYLRLCVYHRHLDSFKAS